ncbi:PAAR-like domain-containing protein [Methylobacterium sp. A49B]
MSLPREGARVTREGIVVSTPMNWGRSPQAIVPYRLHTQGQIEGASAAGSVRQTDQASYVEGSLIKACYGDEAATGGGVQFGTQGAECEPKTWSKTVKIQDQGVVRHDDAWWMNHKETWGTLTYLKDTQSYPTPDRKEIKPRIHFASPDGTDPVHLAFYEGPKLLPRLAPGMERFLGPRGSSAVPKVPPRLAPKPGPEPGPEPAPGPRGPGGFRVSGCRSDLICFERKNYDETEYRRQLKIQQDGLNAKTACQNKDDIARFDAQSPAEKEEQRRRADRYKERFFVPSYMDKHPGFLMDRMNALHRIDMVAGGYEEDFADMGIDRINKSIGAAWPADSRKGKLIRYVTEMCVKGCRMSVTLDVCEIAPDGDDRIIL